MKTITIFILLFYFNCAKIVEAHRHHKHGPHHKHRPHKIDNRIRNRDEKKLAHDPAHRPKSEEIEPTTSTTTENPTRFGQP